MKIPLLCYPALLLIALSCSLPSREQSTVNICLAPRTGKGPFTSLNIQGSFIDQPGPEFIKNKTIPFSGVWRFDFDKAQAAFNQYIGGNRTDTAFISRMHRNNWDTTLLSPQVLNNSLYISTGIDSQGNFVIIPDLNGNKDFNDDTVYRYGSTPLSRDQKDSLQNRLPCHILYLPIWQHGSIENRKFVVWFSPKCLVGLKFNDPIRDTLKMVINFREYGEGAAKINGKNKIFYVDNDIWNNIHHDHPGAYKIYITDQSFPNFDEPVPSYFLNKIGDSVPIGNRLYVIKNISANEDSLSLSYAGPNRDLGITPGTVAKNFTSKDLLTGQSIELAKLKGGYVLLDFWGTWCGPCKEVVPGLKQLNEEYKDRGLKLISIASDDQPGQVVKYLHDENIPWFNLFQPATGTAPIIETYKIGNYPTFILIDKNGKIIFREFGTPGFTRLQQLFHQLSSSGSFLKKVKG
jgi:thiol-disulfide isomerase/thioredoxin